MQKCNNGLFPIRYVKKKKKKKKKGDNLALYLFFTFNPNGNK